MFKRTLHIIAVLTLVLFGKISAQTGNDLSGDSLDTKGLSVYHGLMHNNIGYLTGKVYQLYFNPSLPNPFFLDKQNKSATLFFNGKCYKNMQVIYDTFQDELIVQQMDIAGKACMVSLNSLMVDSIIFHLARRNLKFVPFDADNPFGLEEGYYELARDGINRYLIKHYSTKEINTNSASYAQKTQKILLINGKEQKFRTRRQFLNCFGPYKKQMSQYMKAHTKSAFHSLDQVQIGRMLTQYEKLSQEKSVSN